MTVGVAIITHRAAHLLPDCLAPLRAAVPPPGILVVNSSSGDGTVEIAQRAGVSTLVVPRREFNHGATRELARRKLGTDVVVMMTPDARLQVPAALARLVQPLVEGTAAVAYARQIPRPGAGFFEAFPRAFNYPAQSELRSMADAAHLGPFVYFCSNACAAWSNRALDQVGGFEATLTQEDGNTATLLLHAGHRIAYVAEAVVIHSHRYGLWQEFQRHFDIGLERGRRRDIFFAHGRDSGRGRAYCRAMFAALWAQSPHLIPYGCAVVGAKALGYQLGCHGQRWPRVLAKRLSAQEYYWDSVYATAGYQERRERGAVV